METAAFKRACKYGMAPYRYGRINVTGKYGDGKTSLIQALLGKPIPKKHVPTDGLDASYSCKVDITKCTEEWSELLIEKKSMVDDRLATSIIRHAVTDDGLQKHEQPKPNTKPHDTVREDNSLSVNMSQQAFASREKTPAVDTEKVKYKGTTAESAELVKDEDKQLYEKVNKMKDEKHEDQAVLFIWDYGGQDVYTNLHPIFLRTDCVHIVVFDLQKLENAPHKEELKNYANEIEFWLQMIQSNRPETDNVKNVLLVGTHKDKLKAFTTKGKEKVAMKLIEDLKSKLEGKKYKDLITDYFHVNSKAGVRGDPESFKRLKECLIKSIHESKTWGKMRPVPYMRLLGKLYEQEGKPEHAIMSIKDINQYAAAYNITSEEDVHQFLMFHHATGDLTYFPEIKDFVIVSAQWLINIFTSVITIEEYHDQKKNVNQTELKRLMEDGLIQRDGSLLAELWKESGLIGDEDAVVNHLTQLMRKFDLMVEQGDRYYQVPCLLKEHANLEQLETDNPTIYLQFHVTRESHEDFLQGNTISDHFLPPALFHQLRCRLATCRSLPWRRDPKLNQRNRFRLKVGDQQIILSSQSTWMRLSLKEKTDAPNILENLRAQLDQLLRNCYSNMWYEFYVNPCQETEEGTLECITSTGHSSINGSDVNLIEATCEKHSKSLKTSEYNYWFVQERTGAAIQAG